jgi:valyl-tRNA synthetase
MPFLTEEIWDRLPVADEDDAEALMVASRPAGLESYRDEAAEASMQVLQEVVTAVRAVRARFSVPPKTAVDLVVKAAGSDAMLLEAQSDYLEELAGVGELSVDSDAVKPPHSAVDVIKGMELYLPLEGLVDLDAERSRLDKEISKARADLQRVEKKLANRGFLAGAAPEIVDKERGKQTELSELTEQLERQLAELSD